jgi:hypothetical protein
MRQTLRSDPGTACRTGPITSPVTRWWRLWTKSASTAPSSSPRFPYIATTRAMRCKCNELIPAGSPLLSRVFDAWGFDRCLWGTDWTRASAVVNYEQAVEEAGVHSAHRPKRNARSA